MKRSNGEGTIAKYKDGWRGRYTDPITGKQRAVYGKSQGECKDKLNEAIEKIRHGDYVKPDKTITTGKWLDRWFSDYYCVGTKQSTQASTHTNIRNLKEYLGSIPLQKLDSDDIQSMIRSLGEKGRAPSTIARNVKILKQAMEKAKKKRLIRENPCNNCELPQLIKPEIPFLNEQEQAALLKNLPNSTHGRAIHFLLGTGMRVSELCGLKWSDYQEDGIHVERVHMSIQDWKNDGYINVETLPKTTNGKRIIPLSDALKRLLNRQKTAQMEECLKTGRTFDDVAGYLFANTLGHPADRHNIARSFRTICKKAGIACRGVHALRHTFATNWVRHSPDIVTLSRILGHADAAFTYKTYCHADQSSMVVGMNMMESFIAAVGE